MIGQILTASKLERASKCPASCALPGSYTESEFALRGNIIHKFLEDSLTLSKEEALEKVSNIKYKQTCSYLDINEILDTVKNVVSDLDCNSNIIAEPEIGFAYSLKDKNAKIIENYRKNGNNEKNIPYTITGVADLIIRTEDNVFVKIIDYKTGFFPVMNIQENFQLHFLALCIFKIFNPEIIEIALCNIDESGELMWDTMFLTSDRLEETENQIFNIYNNVQKAKELVLNGLMPNVVQGEHCQYCPAIHSCPAYNSLALAMSSSKKIDNLFNIESMSIEQVGEVWDKLKYAKKILESVEKSIKIKLNKQQIPLPNGKVLRNTISSKEVLNTEKAIDILLEKFDENTVDSIIEKKISKINIERVLGKEKSKEVIQILRENNAYSTMEVSSVKEVLNKS